MSIKRCRNCGEYFDTISAILEHTCPTHEDGDSDDDNEPTAIADGGTQLSDHAREFDVDSHKIRLSWHSDDIRIQTEPMAPERARELQTLLRTATVTLEDGNQRPLVDGEVIEPNPVEADE